jgi:DNA-binding NarL/FixJ family response regulator
MDYFLGKSPYDDRELYPLATVIFLDLRVPGRSGLEILEWLNEHPEIRRPRIIVYTQETRAAELERACLLGADAILIKDTLKEQIGGVLAQLSEAWRFGDPPAQGRMLQVDGF